MHLHFIPFSRMAVLPFISVVAAFSYIFNTAAQKCCILYTPDWNALPDLIITSAEVAEDGVARFTSLVKVRD